MPLAEAKSLILGSHKPDAQARSDTNPTLARRTCIIHFELHNPRANHKALKKLAYWCEQFSPTVGLEETDKPQSLLLDISGLELVFQNESSLVDKISKAFTAQGYAPKIAIADTIGAAWATAHFKPQIIPPRTNQKALTLLPIESLRLPSIAVERFHQLGVFQIAQLLRLPRASLPSRFGAETVKRLDQALGIEDEIIVPHRMPPEFAIDTSLEYPTANRQSIKQILTQLTEKLTERLATQDHGAVRLECRLDCEAEKNKDDTLSLSIGLFQPTASPAHLMELLLMQLERLSVPGPVNRVSAAVVLSSPLERRQFQLFDSSTHEQPRQLAGLVNRLSSRLGEQCVLAPRLQAGALPERAFQYTALTGQKQRRSNQQKKIVGPLQRPLKLESSPIPLEVISIAADGAPAQFRLQNHNYRIAHAWGPERIETQWWRGKLIRRDYYRVETTVGARFWMFRRLQDQKWFLHGIFE